MTSGAGVTSYRHIRILFYKGRKCTVYYI